MAQYEEEMFSKIMDIAIKHKNCIEEYDDIVSQCPKKLMSKGFGLYGMFRPEKELSKYMLHKGRLTKNENNKDFVYYFDTEDRLRLTERYDDKGNVSDYIFHYYYEDLIEIVMTSVNRVNREPVIYVEFLEYQNGRLIKYVKSEDLVDCIENNQKTNYFVEWLFDVDRDYIFKRGYAQDWYGNGKGIVMDKTTKFKKY